MLAVNYSTIRNNLKAYCDKAVDDNETVVITRKNERNVVMMSADDYDNLMENVFIMTNRANYQHIMDGIRELEHGNSITKTTDELENILNE